MGSSNGFQSLFALNTKFSLFSVRPKWVWHSNISVTPSDFRPLIYPFVFYTTLAGESFLSLGLEQLWLNLDPFRSLALRFGIVSARASLLSSNLSTPLSLLETCLFFL